MTTSFSTFLAEIFDNKPKRVDVHYNSPVRKVWHFRVNRMDYYLTIGQNSFNVLKDSEKRSAARNEYKSLRCWDVMFELDHPEDGTSYGSTGTGGAVEVLGTVMDVATRYFARKNLQAGEYIMFGTEQPSPGRTKLYHRFANHLADTIGNATVKPHITRTSSGFKITKNRDTK